jgi:hypothetical protein
MHLLEDAMRMPLQNARFPVRAALPLIRIKPGPDADGEPLLVIPSRRRGISTCAAG